MATHLIYTAAIEHMSGMDIIADTTEAGRDAKIADYCRDRWETVTPGEEGRPPAPKDDAECIERYFNDHENDSLTTDCTSIEDPYRPPGPFCPGLQELVQAIHLRRWVASLETAVQAVNGGLTWERMRAMTVEELGRMLGPNGVVFVAKPRGETERIHGAVEDSARAVVSSYPYLK